MTEHARTCLEKAFQKTLEKYPKMKDSRGVRSLVSLTLQTLSNPDPQAERCKSWDDVDEMVSQVVHHATPEELAPVKEEIMKLFKSVVSSARSMSDDTFISPPSYE